MKEMIIVSACLVGKNTKYNGKNNECNLLEELKKNYKVILFCPELMGGLGVPRLPSEIKGDRVINSKGEDVTCFFQKGAERALWFLNHFHIKKAVLKESSPSCGTHLIYDGTFTNHKISGMGITAKIFIDNGVEIYTENNWKELLK